MLLNMNPSHDSRTKFLEAALHVIRAKGYQASTVEDLCEAAGLTKGSFFHHFESKEELAVAAADYFATMAESKFAEAPYRRATDPLDRLQGYVDFRAAIMRGDLPDFTCLLGTMVQETYETHPAIRDACGRHIADHAKTLEKDIAEAKRRYAPDAPWNPEGLALYTQAVIQGAFILAKAKGTPEPAVECLMHLRRYLETQFNPPNPKRSSAHA
jgi:TetR/AcrR family transcriptional repressor of nem operon